MSNEEIIYYMYGVSSIWKDIGLGGLVWTSNN